MQVKCGVAYHSSTFSGVLEISLEAKKKQKEQDLRKIQRILLYIVLRWAMPTLHKEALLKS